MEKRTDDISKKSESGLGDQKMTRKEAIKKTGFIAASAATMMVLLSNPAQAHRRSGYSCSPSGDGSGGCTGTGGGGSNDGGGCNDGEGWRTDW